MYSDSVLFASGSNTTHKHITNTSQTHHRIKMTSTGTDDDTHHAAYQQPVDETRFYKVPFLEYDEMRFFDKITEDGTVLPRNMPKVKKNKLAQKLRVEKEMKDHYDKADDADTKDCSDVHYEPNVDKDEWDGRQNGR